MPALRPLQTQEDGILVLDQTRLPYEQAGLTLRTLEACARAIETMQVRGAPLIGVTAAFGVALAMRTDASDAALASALTRLERTRPTAVNLHWALNHMEHCLQALSPETRVHAAWQAACALREADLAANQAIGHHGAALLRTHGRPVRIMTHCNAGALATCGWGTALAPLYVAQEEGILVEAWVSETRPRNQGLLTAWELDQAGIPYRLIADNAAGLLLMQGEVDLVIVGADRIAANGDTANKIGTYLKALAAAAHGVPFYIAAPTSTVDPHCPKGAHIPIEARDPDEIRRVWGQDATGAIGSLLLTQAECANPAFDITPAALIRGIITEKGIFPPERILEALR